MRCSRYFGSPWVETNLKHLSGSPGQVLDLACGRGRHSLLLLDQGYHVTALDSDQAALAELKKKVPESARERLEVVCHNLETSDKWPEQLVGRQFALVLVVNYVYRPLLCRLQELVEPGGLLVYEAWAQGNEAFACPKNAAVLSERVLRPNELLLSAAPLADWEVLGFSSGMLEDYEGRDCCKQLLCARLQKKKNAQSSPIFGPPSRGQDDAARTSALKSLLSTECCVGADSGDCFLQPPFGHRQLHSMGIAPLLNFGVTSLLELLHNYDPAPAREAHLQCMQRLAAEGAKLPGFDSDAAEIVTSDLPPRLWGASMVRRLPDGSKAVSSLRTETIDDDTKIKAFLASAQLSSASDLEARGEGWTFVVNQIQAAAASLQNLHHRLFCATGLSGGFNAYLTPAGAIGKPPHVDDHDVIVLQQEGEKIWALLDVATREISEEVHLKPGDVLYLPQGIPHHARALSAGAPSLHLAVGLHRLPMSTAAALAALLAVRSMRLAQTPCLSASVLEEMDSRIAAFTSFGGREHWVNQLLPASLHIPLVRALDPCDASSFGKGDCLHQLARELVTKAGALLSDIRSSPTPVDGDAPGAARLRALQQASAREFEHELEGLARTSAKDLEEAVGLALWVRRELVADQHYARFGPRLPPANAATWAAELEVGSLSERRWRRAPNQLSALWRPGGVLRVNGYRLHNLKDGDAAAARYMLSVFSGAAGASFSLGEVPGGNAGILSKLVKIGALELVP